MMTCDRLGRLRHRAQAVVEDALDVGDIGLQRRTAAVCSSRVMVVRFSLVLSSVADAEPATALTT
jgi:hypothetical protein